VSNSSLAVQCIVTHVSVLSRVPAGFKIFIAILLIAIKKL
jgi:hypothetical protein